MANPHPVVEYTHGVLDGSIPACQFVKQAVQRHLDDLEHASERGLHFDRQAAEYALQFFGFLRHTKGEWRGQPFRLAPWEVFILWSLFGWKRANGFRRYRKAYIEVPRKNGKSEFLAGIGLELLVADGEPGAEIYSAATTREQAKIVWGAAVEMVRLSPDLQGLINHWKSSNTLSIERWNSRFQPLGADEDTMDGLNVHGALIDELHAHKTSGIVDVLETAMGARRQPLLIEITTAGYDRESVCWQHHEYTRQALERTIEDDSWFGFIATIDDGDDWRDPAAWIKANPNYGLSVKPDNLASLADKAQQMPMALNAFLRLHLSVWTQQSDRFIGPEVWEENAGEVGEDWDEESLVGEACYGGLDLSAVSDLTAWVMVFPAADDPETLDIIARFWCPQARLEDPHNQYMDQYQAWVRSGFLQVTSGDAIDYGVVKAQVLKDAQRYRLIDMNVDRLFQGYQLSMELADEGLEVFGMGQGFLSMAVPMHEFEGRLLKRKLRHHGNPVLRWMAGNLAVKQDAAGSLKPDKVASQGRIDGIVALIMALDRAMRREPPKRSVYEDRGLEVV